MGYVPIVIMLLGFIVLASLYIYNKIKPLKANLTRVIDEMAEVSRNRKHLILNYDRENEGSPVAEAAAELKKTSTDRFQSFNKENLLLEVTDKASEALEAGELKEQIHALNRQQEELIQKLQRVSATYNDYIGKPSVKPVASLFGFRPF